MSPDGLKCGASREKSNMHGKIDQERKSLFKLLSKAGFMKGNGFFD